MHRKPSRCERKAAIHCKPAEDEWQGGRVERHRERPAMQSSISMMPELLLGMAQEGAACCTAEWHSTLARFSLC